MGGSASLRIGMKIASNTGEEKDIGRARRAAATEFKKRQDSSRANSSR